MKGIKVNDRYVLLKTITELDLMTIETKRATVTYLKGHLEVAERALAEAENEVKAKLEHGCKIAAKSALHAVLDEVNGPRRPEWKELYLDHMEEKHGIDRRVEESVVIDCTASKPKQILRIFHRGQKQ